MKSILDLPTDAISQYSADPKEFWQRVSNYLFTRALESARNHLLVRTALQSRTQLLRNAGRIVLFYLERVEPSIPSRFPLLTLSLVVSSLAQALFGAADARREYWLSKEERDELEVRTAQAADGLLQQVQKPPKLSRGLHRSTVLN